MTVHELSRLVHAGSRPAVLDVRTTAEYRAGHVPGAVHVPFWLVPMRLADVPARRDERLIVYCGHGPRAVIARTILQGAGFRDVVLLEGHWQAWQDARLPQEAG